MRSRRFSLRRLLRSRRLAVGLILAVAAYAVVGTLVPQTSAEAGADVARFGAAHPFLAALTRALGLQDAWSSPLFLAMLGVLALSTAACAWERTTASWRTFRRSGSVSEADIRLLREHPRITVPIGPSDEAQVLERAEAGLRRLHLRVRRGPKLIEASAGPGGLLGSPLFHVTLAVLFLVIALGRVSRSEGVLGVPVGSSVIDERAAYAHVIEGPLYPGHSGLTIGASDLVFQYRDRDGIRRGASPVVSVSSRGRLLASQHVYPNAPLREGGLLIHMSAYGLAPEFALESPDGSVIGTAFAVVDFDSKQAAGTSAAQLDLTMRDGSSAGAVRVVVPAEWDGKQVVGLVPRDPHVIVSLEGSSAPPVTLRPGQSAPTPQGTRIKLVSVGYYARLTVADDWSIYPIYILFLIAGVAMSVAVVMPHRTVHVLLTDGKTGPELHAVLRHRRGDPLFAERVEAALREAAEVPEAEEEESA